jgi:hypothetical protein
MGEINGVRYLRAEDIVPLFDPDERPGVRRVRQAIRAHPDAIASRNRPLLPADVLNEFIKKAFKCRSSSSGPVPKKARGASRKGGRVARKPILGGTTPETLISKALKLATGL